MPRQGTPAAVPSSDRATLRAVARSLDAPPSLTPVLPDLFADLPNLGSMPIRTANLLRRAGLRPGSRVLDLACGKGTLALHLARVHQCRVTAVDAFAPFLDEGRAVAARAGVASRVRFVQADVHAFARSCRTRFDAALMMGLDPLDTAGPLLRSLVKRGGLYAIDDVLLDPRHPRATPRLAAIPTRADCFDLIASWSRGRDEVACVHVPSPASMRRLNDGLYARLHAAARRVARTHPRLRPALREFIANQRHANRLLGGPLRPAIWVIRREP